MSQNASNQHHRLKPEPEMRDEDETLDPKRIDLAAIKAKTAPEEESDEG